MVLFLVDPSLGKPWPEEKEMPGSGNHGTFKVLLSLNPRISSHRGAMQDNADVDGQVD